MADPFGMTGTPGSNFSGSQNSVPTPASSNTPSLGGSSSPFTPQFPGGTQTPPVSSTINAAPTSGQFDVASLLGFGQGSADPLKDITKALQKAGFSAGIAGELADFLKNGAGFNPAVAQAMIAAMQPGVQRKEADIMEQFSGLGLRGGSPAGVAMGDFLAQEQLNEGQIWAQMYEQSVQNYMNVLLSGKGPPHKSFFDNLISWMGAAGQAEQGAAKAAATAGGA